MKFTASGVTFSAAMTRSPSFSRSGESTTTTISPRAIASTASSIGARPLVSNMSHTPGLALKHGELHDLPAHQAQLRADVVVGEPGGGAVDRGTERGRP